MEKIIKLKSRASDFGNIVKECDAPNSLVMVEPGKSAFVDELVCDYDGELWNTVFPFKLSSPYSYWVSETSVDPSGGPMIIEGAVLTIDDFFKHCKTQATESQMVGCEKPEEALRGCEVIEKDLLVVRLYTNPEVVILLSEVE